LFPALKSLLLPAIALALPQAAILTQIMRSATLETLREDYIRTARAKGLSKRQTMIGHALRNALIPVLTILGLQFAFLLAGGVIIENVFYLPGVKDSARPRHSPAGNCRSSRRDFEESARCQRLLSPTAEPRCRPLERGSRAKDARDKALGSPSGWQDQ
jgi:hypothetical protein